MIIIPSKNIYDYSGDIVRKNILNSTSAEQTKVRKEQQSLYKLSWNILTEQDSTSFWGLLGSYKFTFNGFPSDENITFTNLGSTGNGIYAASFNLKISNTNFIDIKTLKAKYKTTYKTSNAKSTNFGDVDKNDLSDSQTASGAFNVISNGTDYIIAPGTPYGLRINISRFSNALPKTELNLRITIEYAQHIVVIGTPQSPTCKYITNFEIDFISDVYILSETEERKTVSGDKIYKFSTNELFQPDTTVKFQKWVDNYEEKPIYDILSNKILNEYKNGKGRLQLTTSISEYYDDFGNLAISTKSQCMKPIDWVYTFNTISKSPDAHGRNRFLVPKAGDIDTSPRWFTKIAYGVAISGRYRCRFRSQKGYGRIRLNVYDSHEDSKDSILDYNMDPESEIDTTSEFEITNITSLRLHYCSDNNWDISRDSFEFQLEIYPIQQDYPINKMYFEINDKVTPMVFKSDGKDYPMFTYPDGTGKNFKVIGRDIYYDGAVWQKITLEEI